ncbi:MAG: thymidine kinase [Deltaproteobacteria bacterium RIFCSPLOWO2_12_FULL_44_12]|nr:MAG: thymidine kinase [Deltaproteobacteria bacterium RIFCSPHIGHO2_01_FULL_43_49]OGQ15459.1 MAG: thymidine kinase [Deltaproteobacteria bacterium RIFCSPHIGHO2_02_FULL_44_53]OGQ29652.1 MAG: thymidine kinase [Deltaproteobacteria bacterium RIFCSPHIGHO2_12_FULL_44_21]OGQ32265.1 MAG: thymidine kinase [Deltaproteobacteria bacterium RIFCSPLOWO2_01_FULL_45_74]OGQ43908.1 MAG: thymidine kinase [Deltaproteobacteria bacterium RIFCSPLOWO2_02_FULL_44_34]OGQ70962.1 MAG: thymidine kinase [Deltaproteobacteria
MIHHRKAIGSGAIEVVCGPMFSGKTEELIRRLRLAKIAKQKVQIFKPAVDNRYETECITSHTEQKFACTPIREPKEILEQLIDNTRVIGIDEVQFFSEELVEVCEKLANRGLRVIVAGLDQDYLGQPFGPMPQLLAIADDAAKLKAVCMVCGGEATKSQRLTRETDQVVVGAEKHYEARCRSCFDPELEMSGLKMEAKVTQEGEWKASGGTASK